MPDQDNTNTTSPVVSAATSATSQEADAATPIIPTDDAAAGSADGASAATDLPENLTDNSGIISEVATKIGECHNILVALSSDPSVDEMAAAIGLTLFLDRIGKRVTAIYSGATPNALKFLKPEETFEQDANILQDFVIALDKEKADHLRYKLDGDYVKIFITPYRARITEEDLVFSYGDFNIDLVLALDVANGIDLDDALREHGRIMHDAVIVNITTGKPGKLGEIEWSDKTASSVCEMIVELLIGMNKTKLEKDEATAFLTGIIAATDRFASPSTTSKTMKLSSLLMAAGANQQLISKNITSDIENEMLSFGGVTEKADHDDTKLDIQHGNEEVVNETKEVDTAINEKESTLLADLKAAEDSLAKVATEVTPGATSQPIRIEDEPEPAPTGTPAIDAAPALPTIETPTAEASATETPLAEPAPAPAEPELASAGSEKVIAPLGDYTPETLGEGTNKYGQMLQDALAEDADTPSPQPIIGSNPAQTSAPEVASAPEINGVPEINYMPMPGDEVLPPPPAPPISMDTPESPMPLGPQPAMQDQVYQPQAANPGSFQIPGA